MRPTGALAGPVRPRADGRVAFRPLDGGGLRLRGGFWGDRQLLNREVTIPHGMEMLEEWGTLDNLRAAAGLSSKAYTLPIFMDSDVYKLLEAIAWERQHGLDDAQERFFASTVDLLAAAQDPNGYLNSYVQVVQGGRRFMDPAMGHELYCAGHMFQAAVAEARSPAGRSGTAVLGDVAARFAKFLVASIPQMPSYIDGHPEVEMALVELYRQQRDPLLLELADDLVARRGHKTLEWGSFRPDYFQDDVPVVEAKAVRGHAVRALYLLSGVADLFAEIGHPAFLRSSSDQWDDMFSAKTYITGGVGSRHEGESFGERYELPPDRAYCETCAAIAGIMWNWRMCLITGEGRFAELVERTLYNGFLSGWGLDGKSFFYVNPLQSRGGTARQPWYRCACCPPNVMRLVASLEHYVATCTGDGLQLHQFVPAAIDVQIAGGRLRASTETSYPYEGSLSFRVEEAPDAPADLAVRVPSWSAKVDVAVNGRADPVGPDQSGYLHLRRNWHRGDEVLVEFQVRPRPVCPDARIDAVRGCFALERGPLVYCFESLLGDGGQGTASCPDLEAVQALPLTGIGESRRQVGSHTVVELSVRAQKLAADPREAGAMWPYTARPDEISGGEHVTLGAVPYYSWANRGPSQMRVWLPENVKVRRGT